MCPNSKSTPAHSYGFLTLHSSLLDIATLYRECRSAVLEFHLTMCFKTNTPQNIRYILEAMMSIRLWPFQLRDICESLQSLFVWLHLEGLPPQHSCTQESSNTPLLSAGIQSLTWPLPYQSILFCHKNTSCPWFFPPSFSLTHPGTLLVHWLSVSDNYLVN